jgi:hypothetical protein
MKPKNFKKINMETFTDNHCIDRYFEIDGLNKDWVWVFENQNVKDKTRNAFRFEIDWDSNTYGVLTVKSRAGLNGQYFHKGCKIKTAEYRSIDLFKKFMIKWLEENNEYTNKMV